MRFVPQNNEVNSPRRRRAGLGANGPFRPPVLARLPEIKAKSETLVDVPDVEVDGTEDSKPKFRLDGAHSMAQTVSGVPDTMAAPTTETIAESLATSQPALPPLPTAEFAETAAKIMAKLDAVSENISHQTQPLHAQTATGVANPEVESPLQKSHVATAVDEIEMNQRKLRIDPGVPSPVADVDRAASAATKKRKAVRNHAPPEITTLDSPWHDWIVKLGGTFIAGLLLVMAYQALQPPKTIEYSDLETPSEPGAQGYIQEPLRVATAPTMKEPGTFDAIFDTDTPTSNPATDLSMNDKPMFVDPDSLPALSGTPDVEINEVATSPGYQSVETGPTRTLNMPATPSLDAMVDDLMPAPEVSPGVMRDRETVAVRTDSNDELPLEPVANKSHSVAPVDSGSAYPSTGYAPITRVPASALPTKVPPMMEPPTIEPPVAATTTVPQQPVAKKPGFSLFPKPQASSGSGVSDYGPSGYKFPTSVHLNGEIQQFSR